MRTHSEKAAIASVFTHFQIFLAILSGVVLFPWVVKSVGAYSYGLWLATGEAVSYVLLGDLGVFAVLPWLIAAQLGACNSEQLRDYLSSAIAIGCALALLIVATCLSLLLIDFQAMGISKRVSDQVLVPTVVILALNGVSYPLRAFEAFLVGSQDVVAIGILKVLQHLLTISLTIHMIVCETGILGLAIAAGLPPLVYGVIATVRVLFTQPEIFRYLQSPKLVNCLYLIREGFGAWLGGIGYRMMAASNGIIFAVMGKPEWGTIYASTNKVSQILSPMCSIIPDSGLVGVSHVFAGGDVEHTRRSVSCLILLYGLIPSIAAVGVLVCNPAMVTWWMSPELYGGPYVNLLLCLGLIISGLSGGMVKLASVVGWRQTVGWNTVVAGCAYGVLGYLMAKSRGLAGLAEAAIIVWTLIVMPLGIVLMNRVYCIDIKHLQSLGFGRWLATITLAMVIAVFVGNILTDQPFRAIAAGIICVFVLSYSLRPFIESAPWPVKVRYWLSRIRIIPKQP